MEATDANATTQRDCEFWFTISRYLLGVELVVQTFLFTLLLLLQVNPAIAIATCGVVLIAGRIAARICKSRLQQFDTKQPKPNLTS